jgi:hypothetical protein
MKFLKNPFSSNRSVITDLFLIFMLFISQEMFYFLLSIFYRKYLEKLCLERDTISDILFRNSKNLNKEKEIYDKIWIISEVYHSREKSIVNILGNKIENLITVKKHNDKNIDRVFFQKFNVRVNDYSITDDWIFIALFILKYSSNESGFILTSLDDIRYFPLKFIRNICIYYDAFDTIGEARRNIFRKILTYFNYKFGNNFIIRDLRFSKEIRKHRNSKKNKCYIPDRHNKDLSITAEKIVKKFTNVKKIKFVSSGWVTSNGDEGILRTIKLLNSQIENSEFHFCITYNMMKNITEMTELLDYLKNINNGHIHYNLDSTEYEQLLLQCHFGLAVHDKRLFGEPYDELSLNYIRRSPSSRVLDYADFGCILLTSDSHRYIKYLFKKRSVHGIYSNVFLNMERSHLEYLISQVSFMNVDRSDSMKLLS